jgi:hypothetical protein
LPLRLADFDATLSHGEENTCFLRADPIRTAIRPARMPLHQRNIKPAIGWIAGITAR